MTGTNKVVRSISPKSIFESCKNVIDATITFAQGDLLYMDTSAHLIKKLSSEANAVTFLGVARDSITLGKKISPYTTDVTPNAEEVAGPVYGIEHKCILKTGDSLTAGCDIYADPATGTRGVASTGTKAIGTYEGAAVTGAAAGTEVVVLIGARFPNDTLKF